MYRAALLLTCLLMAVPAAAKKPAGQAVQFVDRSNILFPEAMGAYRVNSHEQYPDVRGGVSVGFDEPESLPEDFTVTAYVYPIGESSDDAALAAGVGHIVSGVQGSTDYSEIRVEPATAFAVPAPTAPLFAQGRRGKEVVVSDSQIPAEKPDATDADLAEAMKSWTLPTTTPGRRVVMHYTLEGRLMRSVGYVFYRQLMLVKLRISASVLSVDEANFLKLADEAATAIAPSFDIQNFGLCGVHYLPLSKDDAEPAEGNAGAYALMTAMGRVKRANCAVTEGKPDALPKGMLRHTLVYPAGTWD